jgi:uncharacterized protein DUF3147
LFEYVLRFLIGAIVVSSFALLSDASSPKSFGGLFAAAPSVALATLGLAMWKEGGLYAAEEARSMAAGAIALLTYSQLTAWWLMRYKSPSIVVSFIALAVWFAVAFGLWALLHQ